MIRKLFILFIYLESFFYVFSRYELKVNIYGALNFSGQTRQNLKIFELAGLFSKIFMDRAVHTSCFRFRDFPTIDIILFERIPYANICTKNRSFVIDKNGIEIKSGIDESSICVFTKKDVDLKKLLLQLKKDFVKRGDYLIFDPGKKYELIFDNNKLIYYDLAQIDIFYKSLLDKINPTKKDFITEFYPNQKFRVFFKKAS